MNLTKKLLVIGLVYPQPNTTAAGWRMQQILELFKKENWEIHYWFTNHNESMMTLKEIDHALCVEVNQSSVDGLLNDLQPNVVIFDRFVAEEQFGWRVREVCPDAVTILDTEDLHFVRDARAKAYQKDGNLNHVDFTSNIMYRELAAIHRCDVTLIISSFEHELLIKEFDLSPTQLILFPFLWQSKKLDPTNDFSKRKNLVTIGNLKHEPNRALVKWIYQHWELFRNAIPEVEMHVYGAYADVAIQQMHQPKKGFYLKGVCDEIDKTLSEYKVMLATVPFGAGLKGKILDALQYPIPVITNEIGAEGMGNWNDWQGKLSTTTEEIVQHTKSLHQNEQNWMAWMENYPKILEYFDANKWTEEFWSQLQPIINAPQNHRKKHYRIGMMNQQHMQASRYLSRWIEEKNKM